MPNIEAADIKRSRDNQIASVINDTTLDTATKIKEILKVYEETSAELAKHVNYTTRLVDIMTRYKDNSVAQAVAMNDLLSSLDEQNKAIEEELKLKDKISDVDGKRIAHLERAKEDLETQRSMIEDSHKATMSNLSEEQQQYVRLIAQDKARTEAAKEALEINQQRIRVLEEEKKNTPEGKRRREIEKELGRLKADQEILRGSGKQETGSWANALGATGSAFLGAVGVSIDKFKGAKKKDVDTRDMITEAIDRSKVGKETDDKENGKSDEDDDSKSLFGEIKEKLEDFSGLADSLFDAVRVFGNVLDQYVNSAADFIAQNQGQMNAALYGYGNDNNYQEYFENASVLTGSALLEQKTYLQNIRALAQQGIAGGGEVAALLTAVSEKTVPQFNATAGYIRRLVLLQEKDATQKFFGLESILQKSLNSQFGESSYLNQLFDSVNQNLQDAMANLANSQNIGQSYQFTSTVQSWLSSLYEQGVDSSTVTRFSNVINALGSGNISALSSDAGMQKLALLAMDRIGEDYATVLQNGLDADRVNRLLGSMVSYLKDISTQTNSNNVLEAAYSNLFGVSMADMYAFRNLSTSVPIPDIGNAGENALTEVNNRLTMLGDKAYTSYAEQINNVISNLQFSFGNNVAEGESYLGWKAGKMALDMGVALGDLPFIGKTAGKVVQGIGVALMMGSALGPAIDLVKGAKDTISATLGEGNSITALYNAIASTSSSGGGSSSSGDFKTVSNAVTSAKTSGESNEAYKITEEDVTKEYEEDSPELKILKEFEQTLMENKEGKKAFAVSLMGMSDEVLKSFASIFADEDSMEDVFKSTDAKNKLFDYNAEDKTTSNSETPTNPNNNSNVETGSKK